MMSADTYSPADKATIRRLAAENYSAEKIRTHLEVMRSRLAIIGWCHRNNVQLAGGKGDPNGRSLIGRLTMRRLFPPKPPKPLPLQFERIAIVAGGVEFMQLGRHQCHWPIGDLWCGAPGYPYCPVHARAAVSPKKLKPIPPELLAEDRDMHRSEGSATA